MSLLPDNREVVVVDVQRIVSYAYHVVHRLVVGGAGGGQSHSQIVVCVGDGLVGVDGGAEWGRGEGGGGGGDGEDGSGPGGERAGAVSRLVSVCERETPRGRAGVRVTLTTHGVRRTKLTTPDNQSVNRFDE